MYFIALSHLQLSIDKLLLYSFYLVIYILILKAYFVVFKKAIYFTSKNKFIIKSYFFDDYNEVIMSEQYRSKQENIL